MQISRVGGMMRSSAAVFPELEPVSRSDGAEKTAARAQPVLRVVREEKPRPHLATPRASILSMSTLHRHGDLWTTFMRARKRVFIDKLNWNLPTEDGMEFDQYDTPYARWIVIHEYGEILAGVRLTPTTAQVGMHSYMLRDAQRGLLKDIPTDVLFFEAPVEKRIWEASRLFITDDVPGDRRIQVQTELMNTFARAARAEGATHVIGIVPAVWSRWLRRLDMGAVPVGPRFAIDGTRSQAALFNVLKQGL